MVVHHDRNNVVCVSHGLFTIVREDILQKVKSENRGGRRILSNVRPSDQIVGCFVQTLDDPVFHDLVGQIQSICVFDQRPARLATRSIPPHGDVILKVGDDVGGSVTSLDRDGFEEDVHGVDEPFLTSCGALGYEAGPVTKREIEWLAELICM